MMYRILSRWLMLTGLLLVMLPAVVAQDSGDSWTFMQYMAMDNDLEPYIFSDMAEIMAAGSTDEVNLVMQVDRAVGYDDRFDDWTETRRFYIEQQDQPTFTLEDKIIEILIYLAEQQGFTREEALAEFSQYSAAQIDEILTINDLSRDDPETIDTIFKNLGLAVQIIPEPVESPGEVNMGDPQSLVDFIVWTATNYPADKYMLVISTHGGGWQGLGPDYGDRDDMFNLPELSQALAEARQITGIDQFEIIGFDACLMGQLEVYQTLAPHTRYILAAQEVIPGEGWEYTTPLRALGANPDMDGFELGTSIIDAYMDYYAGPGDRTKVDLHLIESAGIPALIDSLETFESVSGAAIQDLLSAVGTARNNAQVFGADTTSDGSLRAAIDLINFMELLSLQSAVDEEVIDAALDVILTGQTTVAYSQADDFLPGARGVGVYFPLNSTIYNETGAQQVYPALLPDGMQSWEDFLGTLHTAIDTTLTGADLAMTITGTAQDKTINSLHDPPVIEFETDGRGIASLAFYAVLNNPDGTQALVDYSPLVYETILEDGTSVTEYSDGFLESVYAWTVDMPFITDGTTQVQTVIWSSIGNVTRGSVEGTYISTFDDTQLPATLIFDMGTREVTGVLGVADSENGSAVFELQPYPGDVFIPTWFSFDDSGALVGESSGIELVFGTDPFTFDYAAALSGTYELTMLIEDLAGNRVLDTISLNIDNEDIDPTLRGFKDIDMGISFLYPFDWGESSEIIFDDGSYQISLSDPQGDIVVYISPYDEGTREDILSDGQASIDTLDDGTFTEAVLIEDGSGNLAFEYSYRFEDELRYGTMVAVESDVTGQVFLIDVDVPGDRSDSAIDLLGLIYNSLSYFAP